METTRKSLVTGAGLSIQNIQRNFQKLNELGVPEDVREHLEKIISTVNLVANDIKVLRRSVLSDEELCTTWKK
jgi:hypothetical protein|tara:strand:- start:65 stop:283 length:219 start_codon:yes stop_codon:yes gene_type:complete